MKNRFLIFGLALISGMFSINAVAQTKTNLTLKQAIETGIANNFDVKQRELQAQSDAVNAQQAKMNLLPNLGASSSYNFNQGRGIDPITNQRITQSFNSMNYNVSSNVVLFNGLAYQNYIKQTSLTYQASQMDWQQQKDNLTINIILAYLQVLSNEDQLTQAKNQAILSQRQVERLDLMHDQGAVKPSDVTDLKGQYAGDQLAIINTENALGTAKISLAQLMNIPYNADIQLERIDPTTLAENYPDTPDKIYQTALTEFAQIKAVDLRAQGAAKAIKVARGQLFPTLSFGAGIGSSYSSVATENTFVNTTVGTSDNYVNVGGTQYPVLFPKDNFTSSKSKFNDQLKNNQSTFYGFNLSIPIFNNWIQRNRIKQAKITYSLRDITAKTARTQLSQAIDQAYINMTSASSRLKTLTEQVNAYGESFREAEIRFNEGVGTSIDYLLAKTRNDAANISLINAKYDYLLRMKILDYYEGKPLW